MGRLTNAALAWVVCTSVALAAACEAGGDGEAGTRALHPTGPEASTDAGSTPASESPLAGAWMARYQRGRATRQLEAAGLARWTDRFFEAEEWPRAGQTMTAVYTFTPASGEPDHWDGDFEVAYFEPPGVWHVGWWGTAEVTGDEVELYDQSSGTTDIFRWTLDDRGLTLRKLRSIAAVTVGIPAKVYDTAYLTDPLVRTDCPLEPSTDCQE